MKFNNLYYFFLMFLLISCNNESKSDEAKETTTASEDVSASSITMKLESLNNKILQENLLFTVGITSVAGKPIEDITGEIEMSKSENDSIKSILKKTDSIRNKHERADPFLRIGGVTLRPTMSKLDLRDYNMVTPVKDQGNAGACWAFGAMAAFESNYNVINALLINASEQDVINCSGAGTAENGGLAFKVFLWMINKNRNVDDESNLPYQAKDGTCLTNLPNTRYFALRWNTVDPSFDPSGTPTIIQIKSAMCRYGVISASVFVSDAFQYYTGGIFKENETYSGTNHAIALIGWDDTKNAWILKNSWGTDWGESCGSSGEKGYMYIDYNTNNVGRRALWVQTKRNP